MQVLLNTRNGVKYIDCLSILAGSPKLRYENATLLQEVE